MPGTRNRKPSPADSLQVTVDKAKFLEIGRVLSRGFRGYKVSAITLTLGPKSLRIEFSGGVCELACESTYALVAELSRKTFLGIVAAYRAEKIPAGTLTLTFRSKLGEFATPLAGGRAKFLQPPTLVADA